MKLHQKLFYLLVLLLPVQLGYHLWPSWSYVYGLRIDYLSPTLYLTDLLIFSILFFWFLNKFKIKSFKHSFKISNFKFKIIFVFLFLLLLSFLASSPSASFLKLAKILELILLFLYIKNNPYSRFQIQNSLPFAVLYSSLLTLAQFLKQASLNGVFWFLGERTFSVATPGIAKTVLDGQLLLRPYATFSHPNALAGFLLVSLILTVPYLYKKSRLLTIGYLLLTLSALALTFSRTIWLLTLLTLPLAFFVPKIKPKLFTYMLVLTILLFSFLPLVLKSSDESWQRRTDLTQIALSLISAHPLIGVGLNNFINQIPDHWSSLNYVFWLQPVHNIFLLVTSETGLIGLFLFLIFVIKTFNHSLKIKNLSAGRQDLKLIISFLIILLSGTVDHYWFTLQQTQLLFTIILGLIWSPKSLLHS